MPLRKDAQRNRERLVEAARAVFAERGLDVALDDVARRAGVSIGTLYNRFPTRADLVAAVFADRRETVIEIAEHALAMNDAWAGFVHFVEQVCRMQAADRGYNDLSARSIPQAAPTPDHLRGHELMTEIVERAKRSGALRPDFVLADMAFVTWAITRTIEATGDVDPQAWRRHLGFVLDGLRAQAAHPLPVPALTDDQVSRIMRSC
ncbi:TetR/AcrR family transcriptional regulator [Pseudonocardia sp. DSM 110487]|uniref:TetR/AcrR family transcriptional regulator n=1 Tax=Pseudonocardia sp. DSM 110487 TaxID=2865833 RepID=UPI001C696B37|nr:TetR/AcrR family transcriptional regulator [Pseudonocardia sp. DSM 110487]QYN34974.1 TetR/AcrR family transcriptional regulator [Pseudonocardia sp. DSM 110487]